MRRVALNAAALAAARAAAPVLSFVVAAAVARRLGAEGLGRYSLAYAWLGVFGLLAPFGLPALLVREGARRPAELGRLLGAGLALGTAAAALLTPAMLVSAYLWEEDEATRRALAVLSAALPPTAWSCCFDAAFLARQKAGPLMGACAAEHLLKAGLGAGLLLAGFGLPAALAAAVAGKALACALSWIWLRQMGVRVQRGGPVAELARRAPVFVLSAACATLYWRVDVFLISYWRGAPEVGIYTAAYRILDAAILLPQSLCQAVYPRLAAGVRGEAHGLWLAAVTGPFLAAVALGARPLVRLLYGEGWDEAVSVLMILIWTAAPYAWSRYQAYRLVAAERQLADLGINAGLLAVNVAVNSVLIPRFGARGAAAATLGTAVIQVAVQTAWLRKPGVRKWAHSRNF